MSHLPDSPAFSPLPMRIGRILWASVLILIGGLLAGVMTVAVFTQMLSDDFFGGAVSAMVAGFGFLLLRSGGERLIGRRRTALGQGPFARLWAAYPYLPYSRFRAD